METKIPVASSTYFGGKSGSGTYQTIINQIPPHSLYVVEFGGMLGIFRHKRPAKRNILIEIDDGLISNWDEEFGIREEFTIRTILNVMRNRNTRDTCSYNTCAFQLFENFEVYAALDSDSTFIYVDPPYPLDTRGTTRYKHDLTDDQHRELLEILITLPNAMIALSTYPNEIYDNFFLGRDEWRYIDFESQTRHGKATERLWMNYKEHSQLHDYQYLGDDYRERERISRKLKRWEAKFQQLAPLEQAAMLIRLNNVADPIA